MNEEKLKELAKKVVEGVSSPEEKLTFIKELNLLLEELKEELKNNFMNNNENLSFTDGHEDDDKQVENPELLLSEEQKKLEDTVLEIADALDQQEDKGDFLTERAKVLLMKLTRILSKVTIGVGITSIGFLSPIASALEYKWDDYKMVYYFSWVMSMLGTGVLDSKKMKIFEERIKAFEAKYPKKSKEEKSDK